MSIFTSPPATTSCATRASAWANRISWVARNKRWQRTQNQGGAQAPPFFLSRPVTRPRLGGKNLLLQGAVRLQDFDGEIAFMAGGRIRFPRPIARFADGPLFYRKNICRRRRAVRLR